MLFVVYTSIGERDSLLWITAISSIPHVIEVLNLKRFVPIRLERYGSLARKARISYLKYCLYFVEFFR